MRNEGRRRLPAALCLAVLLGSGVVARAVDVDELDVPTEVITATGTLPTYDNHNGGQDRLDATFRTRIDFEAKTSGEREVIFEAGGATIGWALVYEAPSTLVARAAGNGGLSLAVATYRLPKSIIDDGFVYVSWTFDVDDGAGLQTIGIILEDYRVAADTEDLQDDWSGGNGAGFGVINASLVGDGNNTGIPGDPFTSGEIDLGVGLEFYADTNYVPFETDTDDDELPDQWERLFSANLALLGPGDADSDDLSDADELALGTDPLGDDSDEDLLDDGDEVAAGTDPLDADSDDDGLLDGEEVVGEPATDPLDPDTDDDGIDDRTEVLAGSDPTDPDSVPGIVCLGVDELGVPTQVVNVIGPLTSYDAVDLDGDGRRDDRLDVTCRVVVDFDSKPDGDREVIWETGGGTNGLAIVYERGNLLVLRAAGNGGLSVAETRFLLPTNLVAGNQLVEVAWSYDVDNGQRDQAIALFVNGYQVGRVDMAIDPNADWSGSNAAAFGVDDSDFAAGGNNTSLRGDDFTSGTIDLGVGLEYFADTMYCPTTTDSDGDELPDEWEALYAPGNLAAISGGDSDGDGLGDEEELALGTNPVSADSDDDGLEDGRELDEVGTDVANRDTDGDGRDDGDEVDGDPATDPLDPDSDDDGFSDGLEVAVGTDPNDPTSGPPATCEGVDELDVPTEFFTVLGPLPSFHANGGMNDLLDATFRLFVDFEPKLVGNREVIFETGGGTVGFSLCYEAPSSLVLRASGNGGLSVATARALLPRAIVDGAEAEIAWTYDIENGQERQGISILVNGYPLAYDALDLGGDWSGTDGANFGVATGSMAAGGNNTTISGDAFTSGTIFVDAGASLGLEFYADTLYCPSTTDRDRDELPDQWEDLFTPGDLDSLGAGDLDGDGLDDLGELAAGTHPDVRDTDGDGLEDGDELALGADPLVTDTDGDGISDGDEANGDRPSDPTKVDTDDDGIDDPTELALGSDPSDPGSPVVFGDSIAEWTQTGDQGEDGWFGGFYNLTTDPDGVYEVADFVEFTNSCATNGGPCAEGGPVTPDGNHWTGAAWDKTTEQVGPWTFLGQENVHPNGTNSAPGEEEWTIRRWIADTDIDSTIVWHLRKTNLNGTGVTGRLFVNGVEVDFAAIAGNDGTGVVQFVDFELAAGDVLDLALTPVGPGGDTGDGSDGSATWMRIVERLERDSPTVFHRGDGNDTGTVDLTDGIVVLNYLFTGGPPPVCFDASDFNDSGNIDLTDGVGVFNFLFLGGPPPAAPGPITEPCGPDPTDDDPLDCASYTSC